MSRLCNGLAGMTVSNTFTVMFHIWKATNIHESVEIRALYRIAIYRCINTLAIQCILFRSF